MEQGWPGLAQYIPSTPADWTPLPRTVQDALDQLSSRTGGFGFASFVWRPGGAPALGVYTTWAALVGAFAAVDPAALKIVSVDDSVGAAHITTGAWANCDNIQFRSGGRDAGPGAAIATVIVDQGASFSGSVAHLECINVNVTYNGSSGALITTAAGQNFALRVDGCGLTGSGLGGSGLVVAGAGAAISVTAKTAVFNGQLFGGSATSTFFVQLTNSAIATGVVNMTAGATVIIGSDGASADIGIGVQTPVAQLLVYDPQPTFVYAPSATGTQNANVFTTWTALFAAAKLSTGPKLLQLSTQGGFAGPFLVDAGTWDLSDFTIDTTQTVTAAERTLSFPDNAFITGTQTLYVRGNLILQSANTVAPVWVVGAGAGAVLDLYGGTLQTSGAGAKPFLNTQGTGFANVRVLFNASVATGTGPTLQADVASTINMRFVGGVGGGSLSLNASTLTGAGTFNVHLSAEAAWSPTQAGVTGTLNFVWDPIVNFQTIQGNGGTGTHTVTATTPNLLRQKSGKVMVTGSCAGATAAADAITVTLVRDVGGGPVVLATKTVTTTAGQLNYDVAFAQVPDTLPDNLAHTYSIQLAGAQNNTVAANQAICTAVEQ